MYDIRIKRIPYPLATSGLLLHSIVISQNRIGHSPIDGIIKNIGLTNIANKKLTKTNSPSINVACKKNLYAYLTVPSSFSYYIAVGRYDIKLNNNCKSYTCTNGPVNILHTIKKELDFK